MSKCFLDTNILVYSIDLNKISFWDALIISAARISKCDVLYSEDLNHGQIIAGIKIENPFLK